MVARRRVRGRLHHLRLGLRGRHARTRRRAGYDMTGRDGVKLSEYWADGHAHQARHPRARLPERLHRAADPGRQPDLQRARTTSPSRARRSRMIVKHALDGGYDEVEVTKEAEDAWIELLLSGPGHRCSAPPTARPATTTTRASRRRPGRELLRRLPARAPWPTSSTSTQWRSSGRLRGPRVPVVDRHQLEAGRRGRPWTWDTTSSGTGVCSSVGSALAGKSNTPIIS